MEKLSISLPEKVMDQIGKRAASCNRTVPNYIKTVLELHIKQISEKEQHEKESYLLHRKEK